jgi:excisionase family DNA binding protein
MATSAAGIEIGWFEFQMAQRVEAPTSTPAPAWLLDRDRAAEYLSISPRMLDKLTRSGDIRSLLIGRCRRWDVRDLDAYIEHRKRRTGDRRLEVSTNGKR